MKIIIIFSLPALAVLPHRFQPLTASGTVAGGSRIRRAPARVTEPNSEERCFTYASFRYFFSGRRRVGLGSVLFFLSCFYFFTFLIAFIYLFIYIFVKLKPAL